MDNELIMYLKYIQRYAYLMCTLNDFNYLKCTFNNLEHSIQGSTRFFDEGGAKAPPLSHQGGAFDIKGGGLKFKNSVYIYLDSVLWT